jgi:alkanesulfonate monooxygenase SsuD/methylene tetrahydromethanopterin reductase-like flavin-dependent oxidoreductase (luciferase family)
MAERLGELGFYTLAGAPESPRELIEEVAQAEALGLGTVFLSERFDLKEAATIISFGGVDGPTHHCCDQPQHPPPDGTAARHDDTRDRRPLRVGHRPGRLLFDPTASQDHHRQMEDFVGVMRRLSNEMIFNHDGPIGSYRCSAEPRLRRDIELSLVAFGLNSWLGGWV